MSTKDRLRTISDWIISKSRDVLNLLTDDGNKGPDHGVSGFRLEPQVHEATCLAHEEGHVEDDGSPAKRPRPKPLTPVKRASTLKRNIKAVTKKIDRKKAPFGLSFVGLVAIVFASLYLTKLLGNLDMMQEEMTLFERLFSSGFLLFLFYYYISYVLTIFQLKSGLRGSWAAMMRSSGSYIILMLLMETHLFDGLPFRLVSFPSWILALCMAAVMAYMMLPFVREYYKPDYADMVPLTSWILFIFWMDPFKSSDNIDIDVDIDVDVPS